MSQPIIAATLVLLLTALVAPAQEPTPGGSGSTPAGQLTDDPLWQAALAAHRDGLSEVAVLRLRELAERPDLSAPDRYSLNNLLAESLIRAGQYQAALDLLPADSDPFWRGIALVGLGRLAEAAPMLATCAADPANPNSEHALLTLASSQAALGDLDHAIQTLKQGGAETAERTPRVRLALAELLIRRGDAAAALELLPAEDKTTPSLKSAALMLTGEAHLAKGAPASAELPLRTIISSPPGEVPATVTARATLLLADSLLATGNKTEAINLLKGFIEIAPAAVNILPAFDRLSIAGAFEQAADVPLLNLFQKSSRPQVARAAEFFQSAIATGGRERPAAIERLTKLADGTDSIAVRSKLLLAECCVEDSDRDRALAALAALKESTDDPVVAARVAFVEAKALHATGDFKTAADRFASVADSGPIANQASFNAALASLRAGDEAAFRARSALLPEISGDFSRGSLQLERALYMASLQSKDAIPALETFLRDHPAHPRAAEAHLALGSLHILASWPPKTKSANTSLEAARSLELDARSREQADYLAFWIAESSGESETATELADQFVGSWPKSPLAPGVRMRQAEIHFRNGDFLDALLNFEKLFANYPDSALADKATFFAGRAAMLTLTEEGAQRALALWGKLAQRDSPLAPLARRHQAQTKLRQGDQEGAIKLLDAILERDPTPPLRISALLLKGEALFVLGASDPAAIEAAIEMFSACLDSPEIRTAALNEALFRKGKAHEALGQLPAALDAFHMVVSSPRRPLRDGESPEFVWFYRAGFEAIRILDSRHKQGDVRAAISIADALASAPGPRAAEARKTAEQLRLENFIWEG